MDRDARWAHYSVTRYASYLAVVAVRSPFGGVHTYEERWEKQRVPLPSIRDRVYIDEVDSRYGSGYSLPVSSASCKILTTVEIEARSVGTEKVYFSERLHERASLIA